MRILYVFGNIMFWGSGLYLYIVGILFFYYMWGFGAMIVYILIPPVAEIYPFIVWGVLGYFPSLLFLVWFIGIVGIILAGITGRRIETE